ncbi:hypothetical protein GIB67_002110, partial [Kingdonia uniflora]
FGPRVNLVRTSLDVVRTNSCTHWNFGPGVNLVRTSLELFERASSRFALDVMFEFMSFASRSVLLVFSSLVYKEDLGYFVSHLLVSLTLERLGFEETPLKLEKLER